MNVNLIRIELKCERRGKTMKKRRINWAWFSLKTCKTTRLSCYLQMWRRHQHQPKRIACWWGETDIINTNEWCSLEALELYAIDLHKLAVTLFFTSFLAFIMCHKLNDYFSLWTCSMQTAHRARSGATCM